MDVGTASGFLAFSAEKAGAAHVTAVDVFDSLEIRHLQFAGHPFHSSRNEWLHDNDAFVASLKRSFWYSWHRLNSGVEVFYVPIDTFPFWDRQFDVVFAGALVEHLSDPISAIGHIARLAKEAVIIAFTPVIEADDQIMKTANDWSDPVHCFTWWTLSRGLYNRIFENLGFTVEYKASRAIYSPSSGVFLGAERPTIIARRIKPANTENVTAGIFP
ncbi:class I SAM-dependent methyltransferase [Methylocystis sp. JR02]|nr:class I SAM-dependent methyltransferase [Methylocystis sp. JR02]MDJ0447106.1 class I SAM-dependent methyltransferase [Methylocystis sp. JR02]